MRPADRRLPATDHPAKRPDHQPPALDPDLSVIIPALNESGSLPGLLVDLQALGVRCEVIVVDGGSGDDTADVARAGAARVIETAAGRGRQLAAGAREAKAPVLCFLHADVRLDSRALRALEGAVNRADEVAVFRLAIDARGVVYRLIEWMANNVRTRLLRTPYGDQGLLVSRVLYDRVGGYRDIPIMEDVEIVRALRQVTRVRVLPAALTVSARRWDSDGPWRRTFRNWWLMLRYLAGATPEQIASSYRSSS